MGVADLSLSECLFFLGHDPFTGRPAVRRDVLDIGLAGAALGDLVLDGRITLDHGTVVLVSRYATGEAIADRMLAHVMGESEQHGVRDWVQYLSTGVFHAVVENLVVRQLLAQKEKRGFFRHTLHYQPTDLRAASGPRAHLRTAVLGKADCDVPTTTLALLAWTIGLDDICEPDLSRKQLADWVKRIRPTLGEPIAGLVTGVHAAVSASAYSRRG